MSALQAWFAEQLPNRRLYPRRRGPFRAWLWSAQSWQPLIGVDISPAGVGIMSFDPLPWGASKLAAELMEHRIEFRGESVWVQEGTLEEKRVWRGGFKTGSIAASQWREILDFCNKSLPAEEHVDEPPMLRIPPDEIERLVPASLRARIVDLLAQSKRVTLLGAPPSLQFSYGGVVHHGDRVLHKLAVVSSAISEPDNRMQAYETAVYFDDQLELTIE